MGTVIERRGWRQDQALDENYDGVEQPPEVIESRRQFSELVGALNDLPPSRREAILQRELEGRGHEEIAAAMSISTGAVRQLIYRARHALRAGLGGLIPIQLVRMVALSGAAEPVTSGAAGAGLGLTAATAGASAVLATGTLVAGTQVVEVRGDRGAGGTPAWESPAQETTAVPSRASPRRPAPTPRRASRFRHNLSLKKNQAPRGQDRDDLRNLAEYRNGTDPRDADSDGDGTDDQTECQGHSSRARARSRR
ncbi:MAG: RNA polymerase sigma factor [Solirubrobacterales bacterium]